MVVWTKKKFFWTVSNERVCSGVHRFARVCVGLHGCALVCMGMGRCARVCIDMHGFVHVCPMNFQNFFQRIEFLHQKTF